MHELSASFKKKLTAYDSALFGHYDGREDAIFVYAQRQSQKVHEMTVYREYAENYEELENRTIKKLSEGDVWKRFNKSSNPGKAYDDWLHNEEEAYRAKKRAEFKTRRIALLKSERDLFAAAIWNASHGRFTKETAIPYKTPFISAHVSKKEKNDAQRGYEVNDRRTIKPEGVQL